MSAVFFELDTIGIIAFSGDDRIAFLHAQLTSDVAALGSARTQYSGYCSPKGRLLATFLLWPRKDEMLVLVPAALREPIQSRLAKYVMRSRVKVADATERYALFGVAGDGAQSAVAAFGGDAPRTVHELTCADDTEITRLPVERYLLLSSSDNAGAVRASLIQRASREDACGWSQLDIDAGIPVITAASQEQYVPQMVNLDLLGAVSYTKGCYPGQEIVARTHYLGKLKQRMYHIRIPAADALAAGDALYSTEFGADQASGAILNAAAGTREALAVIQKSSANSGEVRFRSIDGPRVEFVPLPYTLPA